MNHDISILVVDDEKVVRESLTKWFKEDDFVVGASENAAEALKQLQVRKWDIIPVTAVELNPAAYEHENISLASIAIDINVLSIDEDKVVVNKAAKGVIKLLERHGFTPVPVTFRHGRVLGGAFHCVTLDVRRRGRCERFLD